MGDSYYIGRRRRKKKKRGIRFFLILSLVLFAFCRFCLYPHLTTLAEAETKNRIERIFNEKLGSVLLSEEYRNDPMIRLNYGSDGKVASATIDTVRLNLLKYQAATALLDEVGNRDIAVSIPISSLFGAALFSWVNAEVPLKVRLTEGVRASFNSRFEEKGINQTLYSLLFTIEVEVYCLLPTGAHRFHIRCAAPACEVLIVGDVPDSFTDIDRLTDDVTEYDIDDAVDFGNVLN